MNAVQIVVVPPPAFDPLHWSMRTGNAAVTVEAVTVQVKNAPPPLPEPSH